MDAYTRKSLSRIIQCFSLMLIIRLVEELVIIPRTVNTKGLIACLGGFVILLFYIRFLNKPLEKIGMVFSRHKIRKGIVLALIFNLVSVVIAYAIDYILSAATPGNTVISLFYDSVRHAYSSAGFLMFALWMAFGALVAVIHASFYEMTFRGLLITLGSRALRFWKINLIQAGLYTLWFLIPMVRVMMTGTNAAKEIVILFLVMLVYQMITAFKLGLLRSATGSVWACIFDHFVFACILDMLHVQHTAADMTVQLDGNYYLRVLCYQGVSMLMVFVYYLFKKKQIEKKQKSRAAHSGSHHHHSKH